jgi:hypothetical protein
MSLEFRIQCCILLHAIAEAKSPREINNSVLINIFGFCLELKRCVPGVDVSYLSDRSGVGVLH